MEVCCHKADALLNEDPHLEEVRGYQYGDGVLSIKLRLLAMNVAHQPVEYADVAMDTDVDVLNVLALREVLLEILHISDEDSSVTLEVLVPLLVLVADVNDDLIAGNQAIARIEKGCLLSIRVTDYCWLQGRGGSSLFLDFLSLV